MTGGKTRRARPGRASPTIRFYPNDPDAPPRELFLERKPFRITPEGLLTRVYFD